MCHNNKYKELLRYYNNTLNSTILMIATGSPLLSRGKYFYRFQAKIFSGSRQNVTLYNVNCLFCYKLIMQHPMYVFRIMIIRLLVNRLQHVRDTKRRV